MRATVAIALLIVLKANLVPGVLTALLASLGSTDIYQGSEGNGTVYIAAPQARFGGPVLSSVPALQLETCSTACRAQAACAWFNWRDCGQEVCGTTPNCQLVGSNCTVTPPVVARGRAINTTAGFPLRGTPLQMAGFTTRVAQGLEGSDFQCDISTQPGLCATSSASAAVLLCIVTPECRAIVVYTNGTDGCSSQEVAVLKTAGVDAANLVISPTVYTLEVAANALPTAAILLASDSYTVAPDEAELEAQYATGQAGGNSTAWLGCIVADAALMAGDVLGLLDGLPSAEACCRECRDGGADGGCTVFNYCARPGGCRHAGRCLLFSDMVTEVSLQYQQCELRRQPLATPSMSWPPPVIVKGAGVEFVGGAPLLAATPLIPGYTRELGSSLFGQPGYVCDGTAVPELQECYRLGALPDLAADCDQDQQCQAFVYRSAAFLPPESGGGAYFRRAEGANTSDSAIVRNPSSVLYFKSANSAAGAAADSAGGLSAGAIAGIAVGAAAGAAALAAVAFLGLRQRGRRGRVGAGAAGKGQAGLEAAAAGSEKPSDAKLGSPAATPDMTVSQQSTQSSMVKADPQLRAAAPVSRQPSSLELMPSSPLPSMCASPVQLPMGGNAPPALTSMRWGRPTVVSPFAAQSMLRPRLPGPTDGPRQLSEEIRDLMNHRARQEAAGTASGTTASRPTNSASSSAHSQLLSPSLPANLVDCIIQPSEIQFLHRQDGSLHQLGQGASGRVVKATYRGDTVAAKEINLDANSEAALAFVTEAARLQSLRHPHVVGFFGMSLPPEGSGLGIIVQEYCEGRDLQSALQLRTARNQQRIFGWHRSGRRVALEVAKALNFLHSKGVVHMDVKSSNVLLTSTGAAKLCDVGISRLQTHTFLSDLPQMIGTFAWAAPEILMGQSCTQAVDLYSFGVLLWEIITGQRPARGQLRMPIVPDECPQEAADLMVQCVSLDPDARPSAQQALQRLEAMQGRMSTTSSGDAFEAFPPLARSSGEVSPQG